jgi:hypothetical protein
VPGSGVVVAGMAGADGCAASSDRQSSRLMFLEVDGGVQGRRLEFVGGLGATGGESTVASAGTFYIAAIGPPLTLFT